MCLLLLNPPPTPWSSAATWTLDYLLLWSSVLRTAECWDYLCMSTRPSGAAERKSDLKHRRHERLMKELLLVIHSCSVVWNLKRRSKWMQQCASKAYVPEVGETFRVKVSPALIKEWGMQLQMFSAELRVIAGLIA